ncbi:MAG: tetratricopeptide repeat protein [Saprospiraceae bacterium]|nr:tetratricopeptide repeat protein [Bacteroidia bacterium]NNE15655.1 tetratricopeptide repeat protein [Saprospiraceae bacterium]NNL92405.1 tetratricopeptide repeat protein [Saprospiraceae bacterium]
MEDTPKKGLIADLWERRLPQFIATYVGICWAFLQFLIFAIDRYDLDSSYIEKFLIFSLVLLPAVSIYIYNHGRPGKDAWKKYEKIIIPINFVLALVFAGLFGGGSEMNAAPTEVTVTTDTGETVTRLVPSIDQTKSFVLFPFVTKSEDENSKWLKFGIPQLLKRDLEQDVRMYCINPFSLDYELASNNHSIDDNNIPFSIYSKIAKDKITDFFVTGEYSYKDNKLACTIKIYETKNGEIFYEKEYTDGNIYDLVDLVSKELNDNLYLEKDANEIIVTDLPASNLISSNEEALKLYMENKRSLIDEKDYDKLLTKAQAAHQLDNQSAMISALLSSAYFMLGKSDLAKQYVTESLDLSETLPERQKFRIRQQYYQYNQQMDKFIPLLESWKKLYPSDYYPHNSLIDFYSMTQEAKKAKQVGLDALENGHGARVLKRLAGICINRKELEEAERYLDEYYKLFPNKKKEEDTQLADIYLKKGEFDKAEKWYESISLLNPNDHNLSVKLANVYTFQGKFDKAESALDEALRQCKLLQDSVGVYFQYLTLYYKTGQVNNFNDVAKRHFESMSKNQSMISAMFAHLQFTSIYASMGDRQTVYQFADSIKTYVPQMHEMYICVTDFLTSMMSNDKTLYDDATTPKCRAIITSTNESIGFLMDGVEAKLDKDYNQSTKSFETFIDTTGSDKDNFGGWIAENYRLSGDPEKAIEYCLESMKLHPYEGTFLFELTKAYLEIGKTKKAKETYNKLKSTVWAKIEPGYLYYDEFISLGEQLDL